LKGSAKGDTEGEGDYRGAVRPQLFGIRACPRAGLRPDPRIDGWGRAAAGSAKEAGGENYRELLLTASASSPVVASIGPSRAIPSKELPSGPSHAKAPELEGRLASGGDSRDNERGDSSDENLCHAHAPCEDFDLIASRGESFRQSWIDTCYFPTQRFQVCRTLNYIHWTT
jgi:hypothetical protein